MMAAVTTTSPRPLACLYCGYHLNVHLLFANHTGGSSSEPEEGDFLACGRCRRMLVFVLRSGSAVLPPHRSVRFPEPEELREVFTSVRHAQFADVLTGEPRPASPPSP